MRAADCSNLEIDMYKRFLFFLIIVFALTACASSPTGRSQLKLVSDSKMDAMGAEAYQDLKKKTPISRDPRVNRYVQCVSQAITAEVKPRREWEVTVFEDKAANAFALPGGKIGVYTGLLKVASNQDQLAAVIGHEVAHVLADHSNARVSANMATSTGLQVGQALLGGTTGGAPLMAALGLGAQYGILMPYGRAQESEADILGVDIMARAGFDPRQSTELWRRMGQKGGSQPPEFLSTHPSHSTRIQDLEARFPQALKLYDQARAQGKRPRCS